MKSISEIITQLHLLAQSRSGSSSGGDLEVRTNFVQPTLHVDVVSNAFEGVDTDVRFERLQGWINELDLAEPAQLGDAMARMPVTFNALTHAEASAKKAWINSSGHASWVSSFLEEPLAQACGHDSETQKYVHFYGYKGGQGRSTVLALLAKALADDGYRVLLVDADIEAPSLDLLFDVSADSFAQTLMGLCGWANECRPLAAAYAGRLEGRVDLLPCRPRNADADLDFALLVATAPVDSRIYQRAAEKLQAALLKRDEPYDVVMVDHRTGIASSVLPLMRQLPGAAAVFARIDFNTSSVPSELRRVVRAIFSSTSSVPGAFVSFSLDPNRATAASKSPVEARVREVLLGELAGVMEMMDGNELHTQIPTTDLSLNWIDWYHDRSLLEPTLPDVAKLQADNIASLNLLREALAVPIGNRAQPHPKNGGRSSTSLSGARDAGQFIHIPEIEKLFVPGNPYSYILGRKGTGKTRLLREMAERGLGSPLLVAADQTDTVGLQSLSIEAQEWLKRCGYDAPTFWWSLIRVGIERPPNKPISEMLRDYALQNLEPQEFANLLKIKSLVIGMPSSQVFLIDGLETLVPAARIKMFVAALFELMGTIQNDASLARKLNVRAFVREDLAADSIQNVEQQMEGRNVRLKWSAASILNYAVSRIPSLAWISSQFHEVCGDINLQWAKVERSSLTELEATELLLQIFPARLRRNNLSTRTFLRLYFSDAGGDDTNKATFYPRLYLSFLEQLDTLAKSSQSPIDKDGRIDSALLNQAYDASSREFIDETKQELSHLLTLEYDDASAPEDDDQSKVNKLIAAFAGLSTPFEQEKIIASLMPITKFSEKSLRESLLRMKSIRMFEDRPGYAGWWRVGQLYKMGLNMKYVRG